MAMDTPVLASIATLYKEFDKCAKDGIADKAAIEKFCKEQFGGWMENPSDPEVAKTLKAKCEELQKDGGVDKKKYSEVCCLLVKAFGEGKIATASS